MEEPVTKVIERIEKREKGLQFSFASFRIVIEKVKGKYQFTFWNGQESIAQAVKNKPEFQANDLFLVQVAEYLNALNPEQTRQIPMIVAHIRKHVMKFGLDIPEPIQIYDVLLADLAGGIKQVRRLLKKVEILNDD